MKNRIQKIRKLNNKGASLVMVISVVALVSMMVLIMLTMSVINVQMKAVNNQSVNNFYDAEAAMDEIRTGLGQEVSKAATDAYIEVLTQYSDLNNQNEARRNMFLSKYGTKLKAQLASPVDNTKYDTTKLLNYIGDTHRAQTTLTTQLGTNADLVLTKSGVMLKNLEVTYTNNKNYVSTVYTDIVLNYPAVSFSQAADVPHLLRYCIVADEGVEVNNGNRVLTINGNLYAGNHTDAGTGGFLLDDTAQVELSEGRMLISKGGIDLSQGAKFNTGNKAILWADNVNLSSSSEFSVKGTTYVADDLNIAGSGKATLSGEYYGFGNPASAKLAESVNITEVNKNESAYSSAIIINGSAGQKATLSLDGLSKLMLAGNAYIGGGKAMMGESLAVKSAQIAYLAPSDCFVDDVTNPTTRDDLDQTDQLNMANVERYHASGVLRQVNNGLSYYFLKFSNASDAATYYDEYYRSNSALGRQHVEQRDKYLKLYVNDQAVKVNKSNVATDNMLNGAILVWDEKGISSIMPEFSGGMTDISDNTDYAKLQSEWQDAYSAYNCKLTTDYSKLTTEERGRSVFENLVDMTELEAVVSSGEGKMFSYTDSLGTHSAFVKRNPTSALVVDQAFLSGKDISLIIATGDVSVKADFDGIIICGGKLDFIGIPDKVTVAADMERAAAVIQQAVYKDLSGKEHALYKLLRDSDAYVGGGAKGTNGEMINFEELVTYYNWSKE